MARKTVGRISVDLEAKVARFRKDLSKASKSVRAFKRKNDLLARSLRRAAAAAVAFFSVRALGGLVKRELQAADATKKFADRIGISVKALSQFQHAAELSGVQTNALQLGLQRMTRRIAEAAQGMGEAKDAIRELGLDARTLAAGGPEAAFLQIADAIKNVESQSQRVRLAFKLFDSEGVAIVNTLKGGSAQLKAWAREADRLGISFNEIEAKQIEAANEALARASATTRGLARVLAVELAPSIEFAAQKWAEWLAPDKGKGIVLVKEAQEEVGALVLSLSKLRKVPIESAVLLGRAEQMKLTLHDIFIIERQIRNLREKGPAGGTALVGALPSAVSIRSMLAFLGEVRRATEAGAKTAAAKGSVIAGLSEAISQKTLDALLQNLRTQEVVWEEHFDTRQALLEDAVSQGLITTDEFMSAELELTRRFEEKRRVIKDRALQDDRRRMNRDAAFRRQAAKNIAGALVSLTSIGANESKKQFELNKKASIAEALISTAAGISRGFRDLPAPAAWANAAAVAASGAAQIAAIRSTTFEGGGSSAGGGAAAAPAAAPATPTPTVSVVFSGQGRVGRDGVLELLDEINEALGDGAVLKVSAA